METLKEKRRKFYRPKAIETLEASDLARNDDWTYLFDFLYHGAGIEIPKSLRKQIKKSGINLHTVLRERQKLNAQGILLPTNPEVLRQRRLKAVEFSQEYSENN